MIYEIINFISFKFYLFLNWHLIRNFSHKMMMILQFTVFFITWILSSHHNEQLSLTCFKCCFYEQFLLFSMSNTKYLFFNKIKKYLFFSPPLLYHILCSTNLFYPLIHSTAVITIWCSGKLANKFVEALKRTEKPIINWLLAQHRISKIDKKNTRMETRNVD